MDISKISVITFYKAYKDVFQTVLYYKPEKLINL